jgi:hypothetical protein
MVLNTSQTWHQLRPGEIRNDCGGCHSHSQPPTDFKLTAAAKTDYQVWDLVNTTPMLTAKARDESKQKWDADHSTGLRFAAKSAPGVGVTTLEYWRDIRPILDRSCVACHTKRSEKPAGNLVLDADDERIQRENAERFPGTYYRLALDEKAKFGFKPIGYDSWGYPNASRYVRKMQSRRSLLVWKIFGERLDGFTNDDHPSEPEPGAGYFAHKGERVPTEQARARYDLDYLGSPMPPPTAVAGTYKGPDGQSIKVAPLTEEDRFTIVRWIDLGCPIDLDYQPQHPDARGLGWMLDDNRPVLTVTHPQPGLNTPLTRLLIGMHDYYSGLDAASFTVTADFSVNGLAPGENLAAKFKPTSQGVWELPLDRPLSALAKGRLTVSVKDQQGNVNRIERTFSVGATKVAARE